MARALARRHKALDAVGELHQADAIVVADGAEGEHGGQLGGHLALLLRPGAELLAAAAIDHQQHGQLAFLDEALDERMAHAGGDVPVDGADVVAGLILAHLLEGDAGALEDGVIFAAEQILDGAAGLQLQAADLTNDFTRQHDLSSVARAETESRSENFSDSPLDGDSTSALRHAAKRAASHLFLDPQ